MLRRVFLISMVALVAALFAHGQATKPFNGHVFDSQSKRGIENLEVKLRPRSNSTAPILIGTTDANGMFHFAQAHTEVYLLEVSQGPYRLYSGEVDLSKMDTVEIPLQKH
jgi:hypothetical protein